MLDSATTDLRFDSGKLLEIAAALARGLDESEVGASIVNAVSAMFPSAAVRLWGLADDGMTRYLLAETGIRHSSDIRPLRRGEGLAWASQGRAEPVYSADVTRDPGFSKKSWARAEGLVSGFIQPLMRGDSSVGTLAVFTREPHEFDLEERRMLELLAAHAALAVANTQLALHLRRKGDQLGGLIRVSAEVADLQQLDDALDAIVKQATRLLSCDGVGIRLVEQNQLHTRSATGLAVPAMKRRSIALGDGVAGRAGAERCPIMIADVASVDPGQRGKNPGLISEDIGAILAVPAIRRGALVAVLVAYSQRPRVFVADEIGLASAFADLSAVVIENARLFEASERELRERTRVEEVLRRHRDELEHLVRERTQELELSHERLLRQERLATLGQFTGTVGHELRNPLGTIRNSLELLEGRIGQQEPQLRRAIDRGLRNVTRCDKIITDLLDFARLRPAKHERLVLPQWIHELAGELHSNVLLDIGPGGAPISTISADPEHLRRALINLVDNAVHATNDERTDSVRSVPVTVRVHAKDGFAGIEVRDKGRGIPEDVMPHIFEPLFSTKSFGVGLGLPYVKRIVDEHGGRLDVHSSLDDGTRVTIWLPQSED